MVESLPIFVSCCLHFKETCFQGFFKKHFVAIFIRGFHQFVHFILKHPVVKSEFALFSCTGCFIAEHLFYLEWKKILKKRGITVLVVGFGFKSTRLEPKPHDHFILTHPVRNRHNFLYSCLISEHPRGKNWPSYRHIKPKFSIFLFIFWATRYFTI